MPRPLLLLDVDGPLNPHAAKPSRRPTGYQTHRLRPQGWTDPHVRPLRVWLNPQHGEQLLALPYDLVWCTTWVHEANTMIGPEIGLPELPVITWPQDARETATEGLFWKTQHVIDWAAGRPFAWVDDDFTDVDRALVAERHAGPALLHYVSPRLGLLPSDVEALTAWARALEQPQAPAPLPPELVTAILRDPDSPYYPSQITVFCDHCGTEDTGDYMVREDMTRAERLAVARKHLVETKGWEHDEDGDDFCPEHVSTDAAETRAEGACALCDVVKPDRHALRDHVLNVHPDAFCGIYHQQPCQLSRPEQPAVEACGKCKTPFDPTDTRTRNAHQPGTAYCRRCVDRCHDAEIADHRCVICA